MNADFLQLGLALFGLATVVMALSNRPAWVKWAPLVGLAAQPLWIGYVATTTPQAWGIGAGVAMYTVAYAYGVHTQWRQEISNLLSIWGTTYVPPFRSPSCPPFPPPQPAPLAEEHRPWRAVIDRMRDTSSLIALAEEAGVRLEQDGFNAERASLEADMAREAAMRDIEIWCSPFPMVETMYYDTGAAVFVEDPLAHRIVGRALRLLQLRGRVAYHPAQPALVRFKP